MDVSVSEDFLRAVHQGEMSEKQVHILPTGKCKRERPRVCVRVCVCEEGSVRTWVCECLRLNALLNTMQNLSENEAAARVLVTRSAMFSALARYLKTQTP